MTLTSHFYGYLFIGCQCVFNVDFCFGYGPYEILMTDKQMANVCASFKFINDRTMSKRFSATRYEIHLNVVTYITRSPVRIWWVDIIVSHRMIPHWFFVQIQKMSSFSNVYTNGLENRKTHQRDTPCRTSLRWTNLYFHRKHMDYVWAIEHWAFIVKQLIDFRIVFCFFFFAIRTTIVTWRNAMETPWNFNPFLLYIDLHFILLRKILYPPIRNSLITT